MTVDIMDTTTENQAVQAHPEFLMQTRGTGKGCKIQRNGAQMLKARHRVSNDRMKYASGLKQFAKEGVKSGFEAAISWTKHKRKDPTPKTKHPKRVKKSSDENSKISGRCKATRFPVLMAANRHRHQ